MDKDEGVKQRFKKIKNKLFIMYGISLFIYPIVGLTTMIILERRGELPKGIVMGMGIMALVPITYRFIIWRCPACGVYLGRKFFNKYCHHCGAQLE